MDFANLQVLVQKSRNRDCRLRIAARYSVTPFLKMAATNVLFPAIVMRPRKADLSSQCRLLTR
jgi:hypothetical protein